MENEQKLLKLAEKKGWRYISRFQILSEQFIEKFQDKVDWYWISKFQKLSEELVNNYIGNYYKFEEEKCYNCNNDLKSVKIKSGCMYYCPKCLR